jgi:hypothetical protein
VRRMAREWPLAHWSHLCLDHLGELALRHDHFGSLDGRSVELATGEGEDDDVGDGECGVVGVDWVETRHLEGVEWLVNWLCGV